MVDSVSDAAGRLAAGARRQALAAAGPGRFARAGRRASRPGSSATQWSFTASFPCATAWGWNCGWATTATTCAGPATTCTRSMTQGARRVQRMGELAYMDHKATGQRLHPRPPPMVRMDVRPPRRLSLDRLLELRSPLSGHGAARSGQHSFRYRADGTWSAGLSLAGRRRRFEALRYGGVLFLYPLMYYFVHPEPYRMRPLDPLLVILACFTVFTLRGRARERGLQASTSSSKRISST